LIYHKVNAELSIGGVVIFYVSFGFEVIFQMPFYEYRTLI